MARYVAFTTTGTTWWVVHYGKPGQSRADVRDAAVRAISSRWATSSVSHADEELENLMIMSEAEAALQAKFRLAITRHLGRTDRQEPD